MARIIREERQQRGCFGTGILIVFWGWNALMLWWAISGVGAMSGVPRADTEAGQAGQAIGFGIGLTMILVIWGAGTLILGLMVLMTRGRTVILEHAPAAVARADDPSLLDDGGKRDRRRSEPQLIFAQPRVARPLLLAPAPRGQSIAIVGESMYQSAIDAAARDAEQVNGVFVVNFTIEAEPGNSHDPDAVRVAWRGHTVGYLPRKRTDGWHSAMGTRIGACSGAIIYGGFDEAADKDRDPMAGIWLDMTWPPQPAAPR